MQRGNQRSVFVAEDKDIFKIVCYQKTYSVQKIKY